MDVYKQKQKNECCENRKQVAKKVKKRMCYAKDRTESPKALMAVMEMKTKGDATMEDAAIITWGVD